MSKNYSKKIEKSFQSQIEKTDEISLPEVSGSRYQSRKIDPNCFLKDYDIIPKNSNTIQGNLVTTLVGLEYTTYRYLKVKPEYDPHWRDREVLEPAEVIILFFVVVSDLTS